jgi:hypothetical protein
MTTSIGRIERSKIQVRPGLLLFAIVFFTSLLLGITPIPGFLGQDHSTIRTCVLLAGTIIWCVGCYFLYSDSEQYRSLRMSLTVISAICTALAIVALVLFTMITVKTLLRVPFGQAITQPLMPHGLWGQLLSGVGWLGSFFGRGRSRILLVIGSTVIVTLWGIV